jgi:hypothetical protein
VLVGAVEATKGKIISRWNLKGPIDSARLWSLLPSGEESHSTVDKCLPGGEANSQRSEGYGSNLLKNLLAL